MPRALDDGGPTMWTTETWAMDDIMTIKTMEEDNRLCVDNPAGAFAFPQLLLPYVLLSTPATIRICMLFEKQRAILCRRLDLASFLQNI